jgi:hypothetical protein
MPVKITRDGRVIRTGVEYTRFRQQLFYDQKGQCAECGRVTSLMAPLCSDWSFHVHHTRGRGMGSSKRDDTAESCVGLCGEDHRRKHGQR